MSANMKRQPPATDPTPRGYGRLLADIAQIVQAGRRQSAWTVNTIMSAVYWETGRRIVEFEQRGRRTAEYGERVILLLSKALNRRFGRGFRKSNLYNFRAFYLAYPQIFHTLSGKSPRKRGTAKTEMALESTGP